MDSQQTENLNYSELPNSELQEVTVASDERSPMPVIKSRPSLRHQQPRVTIQRTLNITNDEHNNIIISLLNTELLKSIGHDGVEMEEFKRLIDKGASPNARCQDSLISAVHLAAREGHPDVLRALLAAGADMARVDEQGRTALHYAVWSGHVECAAYLVGVSRQLLKVKTTGEGDKGTAKTEVLAAEMSVHEHRERANKMPTMDAGSTPLHVASQRVHLECVQQLLAAGVEANAWDACGLTPLDVAGEKYSVTRRETQVSPADNFLQVIKALIAGGGLPTKVPTARYRQTPLHVACELQSSEAIRVLASTGYQSTVEDITETNPLHLCVRERLPEALKTLMDVYGALAVKGRDRKGNNPLHIATDWEYTAGIAILLTAGVDINTKSSQGKTVVHLAAKARKLDLLKELMKHPGVRKIVNEPDASNLTPLFQAINSRNPACVNLLLQNHADISRVDNKYGTVLHCAAGNRQHEILKVLFNHDKRAMRKIRDAVHSSTTCYGVSGTALHIAAYKGSKKCVVFLLERKFDPEAVTTYEEEAGYTALHLASRQGHEGVVEHFVFKYPQLADRKTSDDRMPLHLACFYQQIGCVKELAKAGADLSAVCKDKDSDRVRTAMDLFISCVPFSVNVLREILDMAIVLKDGVIYIDYEILLPRIRESHRYNQMSVLDDLLATGDQLGQRNLFMHPLIESFLWLQWQTLSKMYYALLLVYTVFVFTFSFMVVGTFYYNDTDNAIPDWLNIPACQIIVTIGLAILCLHEFSYFYQLRFQYFARFETWIKLVLLALGFLVTYMVDCPRECASLAILLAWLEYMFLISKVPRYGFYMMMFVEVAANFFKVILSFTLLIFGFLIAFIVTFQAQDPFNSIVEAFVKTMVMMTNEFDYGGLFDNFNGNLFSLYFGKALFVLFLLLVGIVLMNLLVAMTITEIKTIDRLRKKAQFLSMYEKIFFNHWLLKRLPDSVKNSFKGVEIERQMKISISDDGKTSLQFPDKMRNAIMDKAFENKEDQKRGFKDESEEAKRLKDGQTLAEAMHEIKNIAVAIKQLATRSEETSRLVELLAAKVTGVPTEKSRLSFQKV